ncbi:MAG: type II secretion system protein [Puniceicoccaceae bacterium]
MANCTTVGSLTASEAGRRSSSLGFSLIELLMVVAIIGILLGLGIRIIGSVNRKQVESLTQAQLGVLASALEQYRKDFGTYPISHSADKSFDAENAQVLLFHAMAGLRNPKGELLNPPKRPYLTFSEFPILDENLVIVDQTSSDFDPQDPTASYRFADGWDQPLIYGFRQEARPGAPNNTWKRFGYLLFSIGWDGLPSEVTDLGNGLVPPIEDRSEADRDNLYAD